MKRIIFFVLLFCFSANLFSQSKLRFQYKGDLVTMGNEYFLDRLDTFNLANLPNLKPKSKEHLRNVTPLTECYWRIALSTLEQKMVKSDVGQIFATDLSNLGFMGILGANTLFPKQMKQSLIKSLDSYLNGEVEERKAEEIVWLWAASDLYCINYKEADWQWLLDKANESFKLYYNKQFDNTDGLYKGSISYYPLSDNANAKSLAINCLYYKAFEAAEIAADSLNLEKESHQWAAKKEKLRLSIIKEFRKADSTFASIKLPDRKLYQTADAIGSSLVVLFNIVRDSTIKGALNNYPSTDYGVSLFSPSNELSLLQNPEIIRPLGVNLYCKAKEHLQHKDLAAYNASVLIRDCAKSEKSTNSTLIEPESINNVAKREVLYEFIHDKTGIPDGEPQDIITASAFIDVCLRANLLVKKTE